MAKVNVKYECNACGYQSLKYMGRCPNCKKWASMEEVLEAKKATSNNANGFDYAKNGFASFWNNKYNPSGE